MNLAGHFKSNNYYRWTLCYIAGIVTAILVLTVVGLL